MPRLGAVVDSPDGSGVVADRDATYGEALVRLNEGSPFDTSHGRWYPIDNLTVTGFDPDAMVWWGQRRVRASETTGK